MRASRGVKKEKRLLRRALAKGETLVKAIKLEKEQARCATAKARELERLMELALPMVDEAHQRLEAAERIEAVLAACRGRQQGLVRTAAGWMDWAVAAEEDAGSATTAGTSGAEEARACSVAESAAAGTRGAEEAGASEAGACSVATGTAAVGARSAATAGAGGEEGARAMDGVMSEGAEGGGAKDSGVERGRDQNRVWDPGGGLVDEAIMRKRV
eukprot:SAG11_NODE_1877_length_4133_cov_20.873079_1_plen_215_part_00